MPKANTPLNHTDRQADTVQQLATHLARRQWQLVTVESCTGGMIACACTDLAGSSAWFERGFVTYSNESKMELLGVDAEVLQAHGAVSQPVALAMAMGAIAHSHAQVAVSVTGIAGPTGGSTEKPVGTVWFGFMLPTTSLTESRQFTGDRAAVRKASTHFALTRLLELVR